MNFQTSLFVVFVWWISRTATSPITVQTIPILTRITVSGKMPYPTSNQTVIKKYSSEKPQRMGYRRSTFYRAFCREACKSWLPVGSSIKHPLSCPTGLALRDDGNELDGSFNQLLKLQDKNDPQLLHWIQKKQEKYTCCGVQNKILQPMVSCGKQNNRQNPTGKSWWLFHETLIRHYNNMMNSSFKFWIECPV